MDIIVSKDNSKLKLARKIAAGRLKKYVFVEGLRLVRDALRAEIEEPGLFVSKSFYKKNGQFFTNANADDIPVSIVTDEIFGTIAQTKSPQGVILIGSRPTSGRRLIEETFRNSTYETPIIVCLHKANNPANIGAIIRAADAAGAVGVITTCSSADAFSPTAIRAAMGSTFRIPVWTDITFEEILSWSESKGLVSTCADVNAKQIYTSIMWDIPRLLIFGSEANGLSAEERSLTKEQIVIPMSRGAESLNLSVSCGIILFEARRMIDNSDLPSRTCTINRP